MVTGIMKPWKKIAIGAGIAVLLAIIVGFTVHQSSKNVVDGTDRESAAAGSGNGGERFG